MTRAFLLRMIENILLAGFVAMIALVFGNVVMRYLFDSGIILAEEVARMIFVWLTFGGAFLVAREGGHLGMTSLVARLSPPLQKSCRILAELVSFFCIGLVILGSWRQIVINIDNYAPITGAPLAIPYIAAFVGGIGIAGLNLHALWRLFSGRMASSDYIIGTDSEEFAGGKPGRDNAS